MPVWGELIVSGNRELGVHALQKPTIIIGRSSKADVKIQHHQISGQHCQINWDEVHRRVAVVDKSSNGTLLRINGACKKMAKNVEYEINDCDSIILVKNAVKSDEIWFQFRRVSASPSGLENVIPRNSIAELAKKPEVPIAPLGQGDTNEEVKQDNNSPPSPEPPQETFRKLPIVDPPLPLEKPEEREFGDSFNDSADLPDFDDVLKPYSSFVPSSAVPEAKPQPPPPVLKIFQYPVKRPSTEDSSPTSGPSAAKKSTTKGTSINTTLPAVNYPTGSSTSTLPPTVVAAPTYIITRVTAPVSAKSSDGVDLDDSDDLPDLIPDFKAPASVAELRAKPIATAAPTLSTASKTSAPAPVVSAAERARKLLASTLPSDFLSETTPKTDEPAASDQTSSSAAAEPASKPAVTSSVGNIEENLICTICQEIFHEPINVTPCNHVFCAGCLSMWLAKEKTCPQCRTQVASCAEHHLLKSLVEAFLASNTDRKRTPEELAELDKHNTITKNKNKKPSPGRGRGGQAANQGGYVGFHQPGEDEYGSDSDSYNSEYFDNSDYYDDSDSDDYGNYGVNYPFVGNLLQSMQSAFNAIRGRGGARGGRGRGGAHAVTAASSNSTAPWGLICQQCPGGALAGTAPSSTPARGGARGGRRGRGGSVAVASSALAGPSTSTAVVPNSGNIPAPSSAPPYTCTSQSHHTCRCCTQRFPNREGQPGVSPVRCGLCQGLYCHLYWGCRAPGCLGCLGPLNAFTTTAHELEGGIGIQTNTVEAGFFADYLNSHNVSPQSVLAIGYQLIELNALPELNGITPQSIVCRICFKNKVIPAIAYAYRAQLTSTDLPPTVANRPNCEWGKNCRTQKRSIQHSRKNNHICQAGSNAAGTSR